MFTVGLATEKGYTLRGDAKSISLQENNHGLKLYSVIWTWGGALYCARFCRHYNPPPQECEVVSVALDNTIKNARETKFKKILKINVKQAHEYLGHLS
jgi:hypothetical protein